MSVISSFKQSMRTVYIVTVSSFLICERKLGMQFDHHHQVLPSILQEFMDQFNHFSMHKRDIFRRIEVAADTVEEPMVPIKDAFASLAKICIKIENICFSRFRYSIIVKVRDNKKIFIAHKAKVKKTVLSSRYQKLKK